MPAAGVSAVRQRAAPPRSARRSSASARERVEAVAADRLTWEALGGAARLVARKAAEEQARLAARKQQRERNERQKFSQHRRSSPRRAAMIARSRRGGKRPRRSCLRQKSVGPARGG